MKGRKDIGEYKIQAKLKNFELYQFGRRGWVDLKNPAKEDIEMARKGLRFVEEKILKNPPDLLVLDEINLAAAIGLISTKEVISLLDKVPAKTTVFMTGRYASEELINRADTATEMVMIKHVLEKQGIAARRGIQY
jgi:cob(I)alamin adenosyltransferase